MKRQHYGLTLAVLAVAGLSFALLQTMVLPALPTIQREYGASTTAVTWVMTVYLLTASIATPVLGRLGDMFGKERLLVIVLLVLAVGTLMAALSSSIEMLIAGRAVQGAGGAIFPLAFGIIRDEFPRERVGAGIGLISATFGIGGGAGLVLAGLIVDHLDYTWIFWLSLVVILAAVVATHFFVPESPVKTPAKIDWIGAALLAAGLGSGLLAVSRGRQLGLGLGRRCSGSSPSRPRCSSRWGRYELRVAAAAGRHADDAPARRLDDQRHGPDGRLRHVRLVPARAAARADAGRRGLRLRRDRHAGRPLPAALVGRDALRRPVRRAGSAAASARARRLLIGIALIAAGFVQLAVAHDQHWHIYLNSVITGAGIGLSFAAMATLIVESVPQSQTGVATGMNTIMRSIGGALGAQISASIVGAHLGASGLPTEAGFEIAFIVSAGRARPRLRRRAADPAPRRRSTSCRTATSGSASRHAPPLARHRHRHQPRRVGVRRVL